MRVAGAVLTGGRSSRMGENKALLTVDGVPMAARAARVLETAGCAPVILVGGDPADFDSLGRPHVPDLVPGRPGPVAGIHAAVTALGAPDAGPDDPAGRDGHAGADAVVVVACDLADIVPSVVEALIDAAQSRPHMPSVVVAVTDRREPLCALWNPTLRDHLARRVAGEQRSVVGLLNTLDDVVEVLVPARHLHNINTPSDLGR